MLFGSGVLDDIYDVHLVDKANELIAIGLVFKEGIKSVEANGAQLSGAVETWLNLEDAVAALPSRFWSSTRAKNNFWSFFEKHRKLALHDGE